MSRHPRRARLVGAITLLFAAAAPFWLWRRVISDIAQVYDFSPKYLMGWTPWALLVGGIAFFIPVAWSIGRRPDERFYPRARNAYLGWGITLYLLGLLLAAQVARIHDGTFAG